jgi:hypothetical protein
MLQTDDVQSIQNFIGKMPGFDDIPKLFDAIVKSGVYDPTTILSCMGPGNVIQEPDQSQFSQGALELSLLDSIKVLQGSKADVPAVDDLSKLNPSIETTSGPKGGISWRVLDSIKTTRAEIDSMSRVLMNVGLNKRYIPSHIFDLTMETHVVTVVMQWTGDAKHHALANDSGTGYLVQSTRGLQPIFEIECDTLRKALLDFDKVTFMKENNIAEEWKVASNSVNDSLVALTSAVDKRLDAKDPRKLWIASLQGVWPAASQDLLSTASTDEFKKQTPFNRQYIPIEAIDMMKNSILRILDGPATHDIGGFAPWTFSNHAIELLDKPDPDAAAKDFLASFGHYLVDSYTEAGTLSSVWTIKLNETLDEQALLLRRVVIERYFATARGVDEVCDYLAHGIKDAFKADLRDVEVSIYGYRTPGKEEYPILDIKPTQAKYYLTSEALHRNMVKSDYGMRAYQDLKFNFLSDQPQVEKSFERVQATAIPQISSVYIVNLQKIMSYLLTLNAYAKEPKSGIDVVKITEKWNEFIELEDPKNLNGDGTTSVETQINTLREALEMQILLVEEKLYNQPGTRRSNPALALPTL